jgi:hypothetical protein
MDDKKRTTSLSVALFLLAVATWPGCILIRISSGIKPAEISLEGIHTLAVLKFDGPFGETVQSHIRNRLKEVQHFRPIDTAQVHALAVATYGQEDSPQFCYALKKLGADGVITGRVNDSVRDIHGTDQMQVTEGTGHYKKGKNIYGEWVDVEITRTVVRPVPYIIRQASLDTEYNVFDVKTRRVITTGMLKETYSEKFGGEKECGPFGHKLSDLPTPDGTVDELAARLATKLVAKLSRMKLARMIKLDEGGNGMVKQGVEFAKTGVWEKAVEIWEQVIHDESGNAAAYYNLGMAHESVGDMKSLGMAEELYKKAASHGDKKLYREAIARIQRAIGRGHDD